MRGDAELAEAARQHSRVVLRRPILWLGRIVILLLVALLIASSASRGFHLGPFLVALIGVYLLFFLGPTLRWLNRRELRAAPQYGVESLVLLGSSGIDVSTPDIGTASLAWTAFSRAVRTNSGFLVYLHGGSFTWLPFAGFPSPQDIEIADALLRENLSRYATVA